MTYQHPEIRVGSIIEITDVDKGSSYYEDFIYGRLELIYRITEYSIISEAGIIDVEQIPGISSPIAIFRPKFRVVFF